MKKSHLVLLLILTFTAACNSQPTLKPTATPIPPTATATITLTPTITATPTLTPTLTPTVTRTPISEEEQEKLRGVYILMLMIEINTNFLKEAAEKVNSGELTGFDKFGTLLGVAYFVNAVEEGIAEVEIPSEFETYWQDALVIHEKTKDYITRWYNDEIDSSIILKDIDDLMQDITEIMNDLDRDMASKYGFEPEELDQARQEALQSMYEIFETPTPTVEVDG